MGMLYETNSRRIALRSLAIGLFGFLGAVALDLPNEANALETKGICAQAIDQVESGKKMPGELMTAISHVESGRWDTTDKALYAWPWAVVLPP